MKLVLVNLILAVVTSFISGYVVLAYQHRRSRFLSLVILGASIWSLGSALEMYYTSLPTKLFWARFQILGMILTNAWPLFVAAFTGRHEYTRGKKALAFAIPPLATLLMLLTDPWHGLIYRAARIYLWDPHMPLAKEYGWGLLVFTLYSYVVLVVSSFLALQWVLANNPRRKLKGGLLWLLSVLPVLTHVYSVFLSNNTQLDPTPTIFALASILLMVFTPQDLKVGELFHVEYGRIVNGVKDLVLVADNQGKVLEMNNAAKGAFSKALGLPWDLLIDLPVERLLGVGLKGWSRRDIEVNGRVYDASQFPFKDWRGRYLKWCVLLRDITPRVRMEADLKALNLYAYKVSAVHSEEDLVRALGEAVREILGFNAGRLVYSYGGYQLDKSWGTPLEGSHAIQVDLQHEGGTVGSITVWSPTQGLDNSQRLLMEILAMHTLAALRGLRFERSLAEAQRQEIQGILDAVGRVTRLVRHDVRSSLQSIKNACAILRANPANAERMMDIIDESADFILNLLEELVYQDLGSKLSLARLDLNALVSQILLLQVLPENVEVETILSPEPLVGMFDKVKIQRMVYNLVKNAVEAMPEGGRLTVETGREGGWLVVSVGDTGVGIEDMGKLFTPFHTTKPNGMGLGLVSVKQTVDLHRGRIKVESEPGVGTCFRVYLPGLYGEEGYQAEDHDAHIHQQAQLPGEAEGRQVV